MEREILFRGQDKDKNWVEGDLIHGVGHKSEKLFILPRRVNLAYVKNCDPLDGVEIISETVGQFTGLTDKNGVKIFEGDIIKFKTTRFHTKKQRESKIAKPKWFKSPVLFHEGSFLINESTQISLDADDYDTFFCCCFGNNIDGDFLPEVIGNIHDNPELLNQQ